jgi:hypothetical protein
VVALAISLMLMAAPAFEQIKWTLPSAYPADNFHSQNLEAFAKDLAEATGGKLSIKVYSNASLLPVSVIKRAVQMGRMQIGETLISLHENEDPIFGIDVVPFLATSYDEARKLWEASKPLVERKLAEQGLMPLFAVPWPPQGIFASKEINDIADMNGLSWRIYNAATHRIAQIVGAYPITIQAADLKQALATGLIKIQETFCDPKGAATTSPDGQLRLAGVAIELTALDERRAPQLTRSCHGRATPDSSCGFWNAISFRYSADASTVSAIAGPASVLYRRLLALEGTRMKERRSSGSWSMTRGMGEYNEIYPMDHRPDSVGDDNEKATTVVADDWEGAARRSDSHGWSSEPDPSKLPPAATPSGARRLRPDFCRNLPEGG